MVMAVAVSLEPFRIGMTVLMLNRPRPTLQLLAFLCGGFVMGMGVGLLVLFALRPALSTSTHFTLPKVQIVVGSVALLTAAVLTVMSMVSATPIASAARAAGDPVMSRLSGRARSLLTGRSLWVAGVAGLGIALPSVDYLAALAVILASGAAAATQFTALLTFNIVAFTLVELPLLAYLFAPRRTQAAMTAFYDWVRSRRRWEVAALLAVVGTVLLGAGLTGI